MGRREFIAALGGAALCTSCLIAVASSASKSDPIFHVPTCDEFKDRLTHTQRRIGISVPDAEYTSYRSSDDSSIAWAISNYLDFDVTLECKDSVFRSMEIQPTAFIEFEAPVARREFNIIEAAIAAWTGWTKARVVGLVSSLSAQVVDDMHKGRIYGEGAGNASYNLPGGAIVHISNGGDGFHMILNSADGESRVQGKSAP